jgi:GNAT superfamily N-acetyltransferase
MKIRIRQATVSDADIITRFNALMAEETEQQSLESQRLLNGVLRLLSEPAKGVYFIAEEDGVPLGQLMITYEWSDWRNGNFWWIQSVYVDRPHRGKGVFRSLYRHVYDLASRQSDSCGLRLYVESRNEPAQRTYERLGMKKAGYEMYEIDFVLKEPARFAQRKSDQ